MTTTKDTCRDAFEAWYDNHYKKCIKDNIMLISDDRVSMWEGFQAAWNARADAPQVVESDLVKLAYLEGVLSATNTPIPDDEAINLAVIGMPRNESCVDAEIVKWFRKHHATLKHLVYNPTPPITGDRQKALDAFSRIKDHVIAYVEDGDWSDNDASQIDGDLQTIKSALTAPAVTDDEVREAVAAVRRVFDGEDGISYGFRPSLGKAYSFGGLTAEHLETLIRAATAPKCEALVKAVENLISHKAPNRWSYGAHKAWQNLTQALSAHRKQNGDVE